MKVRCPTCGAVMSLDVLIAHDDAREALIALTGISDDLFKAILRYLTLFRPAEKDLSFNRVSKLVGEIAPMIRDGKIVRNRKTYLAPREAWIWAATAVLPSPQLSPTGEGVSTKLRSGLGDLMEWSNGGQQ